MSVPVNAPWISPSACRLVIETLDAGWVSSGGPVVEQFERRFAECIGVRHAVSTSSGTTALHLALATLDIGVGDEVIVPDFTMIATACAVLYTGAVPVFVDVDSELGTLDPSRVAEAITPRTRVILPVHIYGHSADMDPLSALAGKHGLRLVEDAAEAHGARYRGRPCGSLGDVAAFSFYGNKIISTGEGGMLTTNDDSIATRARLLRDLAHRPHQRFVHDELGFSYRMGSLQAALGLGQLTHFEELLAHKRWMAAAYASRLHDITGLQLPLTREWADNVHWMYAVRVDQDFRLSSDDFRAALASRGVDTRAFFQSCAMQPMIRQRLGPQPRCANSERLAATGLYLPSGLALTEAQLEYVCDVVRDIAG